MIQNDFVFICRIMAYGVWLDDVLVGGVFLKRLNLVGENGFVCYYNYKHIK